MQLPFHVSCRRSHPALFELSDGRFQKVEAGDLAPWCSGRGYLLVERALADFLLSIQTGRLRFEPAIVFDPRTGQEDRSLVRIRIGQYFAADQIRDLALDGDRLLTLEDTYVFASPDLKRALVDAGFSYLRFSEGLSEFA